MDSAGEDDTTDSLAYSADRGRGILTPSDREFLIGRKTDYTDHSKKQKRNRIRRRLQNALLDFTLLFDHLEERDREIVFDPKDDARAAYTQGITDLLGFLHLGTMGYSVPFKDMLSRGVSRAEQELSGSDYRMVNVEFNVDPVGSIDVDEVIDKLDAGDFNDITDEELRAFTRLLIESDDFSVTGLRTDMKTQMMVFIDEVNQAAEQYDRHLAELSD